MPGTLTFFLVDNNGRPVETRLWVGTQGGALGVLAYANELRGPMLAISECRLLGAEYRIKLLSEEPGQADSGADSRRSATLFYSNGSIVARQLIPSVRPGLVETSGPWAGYRITRESAAAAGLLDELEALVAGTLMYNGTPWPPQFAVGALDERS